MPPSSSSPLPKNWNVQCDSETASTRTTLEEEVEQKDGWNMSFIRLNGPELPTPPTLFTASHLPTQTFMRNNCLVQTLDSIKTAKLIS